MAYNPRRIYDKDYFESGKKSNYKGYLDSLNWKLLAEELIMLLDLEGKTVLDVGCAYGYLVRRLRELGIHAYGIDISDYAMKQRVCELVHGDARYLPFRSNAFHVVIALELIEHIPAEFEDMLLDELIRVSKEWILIRTPRKRKEEDIDIGHVNIKPYEEWIKIFQEKGTIYLLEYFEKFSKLAKKAHPFFADEILFFKRC